MRLVYLDTGAEVNVGDIVVDSLGGKHTVTYFTEPHKPAASGKVSIISDDSTASREVYVSVIGAIWIEREDRE